MSKQVKDIELTFENLDYVRIPEHYFSDFNLEDIKTDILRVAVNAIVRHQTAGIIEFTLSKAANDDFSEFDKDMEIEKSQSFFDRIANYKDLSHITLFYTDGDSETFLVKWDDVGNEFLNRLQESYITKEGELFVEIAKKEGD